MRNFSKLHIFIIHLLFILIYQNVVESSGTTANENGTMSTVTKNDIYIHKINNIEGLDTFRRKIGVEILSSVGRKFFYDWLPSFGTYVQGRCFGVVRKLQMAFIPIFFKLGVIVTILIFLTAMVGKSLLIGTALLFFNFTGFFAKLYAGKLFDSQHTSPSWHYQQPTVVKPTIKNIHIHVHPTSSSSHHSEEHSTGAHYPIHEYGTSHYHPSASYVPKLSSALDSEDIYSHYPSISSVYEAYHQHPSNLLQNKIDFSSNSIVSDPTSYSAYSTNIYQPNIGHRPYDDISPTGTTLTADENAYIQRILSKLS